MHQAAIASITTPAIPEIPPEGEDPGSPAVAAVTDTFTYDALGRMTQRVADAGGPASVTLELTWDASSNLVKTDLDDAVVVYVYDSSGQRVAQIAVDDPATPATFEGTATAYLGATEVTDPNTGETASSDLKGTRFYALGGATVATRTGTTLSFLFGDVQGSGQVMVTHTVNPDGTLDAITEDSVSRNAYTPYGTTRGTGTSAVNDDLAVSRGWLNQVSDEASTGLVYLNARYYDPVVSRFISPDPLMNPSDPKTLDSYRYANNNPVMFMDPSGLWSWSAIKNNIKKIVSDNKTAILARVSNLVKSVTGISNSPAGGGNGTAGTTGGTWSTTGGNGTAGHAAAPNSPSNYAPSVPVVSTVPWFGKLNMSTGETATGWGGVTYRSDGMCLADTNHHRGPSISEHLRRADWGTMLAGGINVTWGLVKLDAGIEMLVGGTAADLTGIGAIFGVPTQIAGGYEVLTGGLKIWKGANQIRDGANSYNASMSGNGVGDNLERTFWGVVPFGGWLKKNPTWLESWGSLP